MQKTNIFLIFSKKIDENKPHIDTKINALKQNHSKKNRLSIGADICLIGNADFFMKVAKNNGQYTLIYSD